MSSNSTAYSRDQCTYRNIQEQLKKANGCSNIANGICNSPHHFVNVYKIYCQFRQNNTIYMVTGMVGILFLLLWLNYIRRSFFTRPVHKLRKRLGISDFMAEATLLPLSFGVVPMAIQLNASYKDVDFVFNASSTIGSMFTLASFVIATCAIVLRVSRRMDKGRILIDLIFIIATIGLIFMIGLKEKAEWVDSIMLITLWVVYLAMSWWRGVTDSGKLNWIFLVNCFD